MGGTVGPVEVLVTEVGPSDVGFTGEDVTEGLLMEEGCVDVGLREDIVVDSPREVLDDGEGDVRLFDDVVEDPVLVFCVDEGVGLGDSVADGVVLVFGEDVRLFDGAVGDPVLVFCVDEDVGLRDAVVEG